MLNNLSQRLSRVIKTMRGQARITEANTREMLREVRIALLEADVALPVVRELIARIKAKAMNEEVIGNLKKLDKVRTVEAYTSTLNSFRRFREERDVPLDMVDSDMVLAYEAYLKANGVSPNSSSFYMRNLRAVYNRAVEKELTPQRFPFKHVYTGVDKTIKRAMPLKVIKKIKEMDLELNPSADFARDMFLFSFYTRGMSFVDMAYLRKKDLANGILSYRRRKTGQQLFIKWEKCMQEIVDKYDTESSIYLLPIIKPYSKTDPFICSRLSSHTQRQKNGHSTSMQGIT